MGIKELWNKLLGLYHYTPKRIKILPENTDQQDELKTLFEEDKDYFDIVVNEMFLSEKNNKNWLHNFDPLVFVTAEFIYDRKQVSVPIVVGPTMLGAFKQAQLPKDGGMIYKDIPVGGRNPYKGGSLSISLILNQFPHESPLKKLLTLVETASASYTKDIFPTLGSFLKIANLLFDGLDALAESNNVKPLIGIRENYADGKLKPGYFALINLEDNLLKPEKFFVKDRELYYGNDQPSSKPFRDNDYVLYSVIKAENRTDYTALPFFTIWNEIDTFVSNYPLSTDNKSVDIPKLKQEAARRLFSLGNLMRLSPDLTGSQAARLYAKFKADLDGLIGQKETLGAFKKGQPEPKIADWEKEFEQINAEIFN